MEMTAREFKLSRLRKYRSDMQAAKTEKNADRRGRRNSDDDDHSARSDGKQSG